MHQVERAIFDLRRGVPVVIIDDRDKVADKEADKGANRAPSAVLAFPVESVAERSLEDLTRQAGSQPVLTLTGHRLKSMGLDIHAEAASLALPMVGELSVHSLYQAAASSEAALKLGDPRPAGRIERAALALLRRALLVPAALTARVAPEHRPDIDLAVARGELLAVPASLAEQCFELGQGLLRRISEANVPLAQSEQARFVLFREPDGLREHLAVQIGAPEQWPDAVPVRLHSACLTGDLFASLRCDCGEQLSRGVARIRAMGGGVLLYLAQEGRGIGLANKLRAYALQDQGQDTVEADQTLGFGEDERRYGVAVDMLRSLGIARIHLLTNNPAKLNALATGGIEVVDDDRLFGDVTRQNRSYLNAKVQHSGHMLQELLDEN